MTLERPMFPPVDPTRRHLLTIAAGGAVAAAIPTAGERINLGAKETNVLAPKTSSKEITPSQGIEGDPIYAAIERHQAAGGVWDAAVDVWAKFPDGPEPMTIERRIERERINDAWRDARDAMDDTGVDLINTSPTTLGGIARALNYIREQMLQDDGIYMPGDLRLADDTEGEYPVAWIKAFLDTIEHAAHELDRAGRAVQS